MSTVYVLNAFSASMLSLPATVSFREITVAEVRAILAINDGKSAVGHADTAAVFGAVLNKHIPTNRVSVKLAGGDIAILGQYTGPRLPEGTTELPGGATITWMLVSVS